MPAHEVTINLIGEEEMDHTPLGRIVNWAVTYGRYIMIGTEIVVLLAFISRFSLDRKLTDLNEEIAQKQAIIEANSDFEKEFRLVQTKLATIKTLSAEPNTSLDALTTIQSIMPQDVLFTTLDITSTKLTADAIAGSPDGFSYFISAMQTSSSLRGVDIGDVLRDPLKGIQFQVTANLGSIVQAKEKGKK